jgi:lysyl-tRNA synthetase class 2
LSALSSRRGRRPPAGARGEGLGQRVEEDQLRGRGESAGSKLDKATELNVEIWDEASCWNSWPRTSHDAAMKDWKPTASQKALHLRARLNALIRKFFADRGVLEVETPMLSSAATPTSTSKASRSTSAARPGRRRQALAAHLARVRAQAPARGRRRQLLRLGRVFRNGEAGRLHNPEFTMLEWYRIGWSHHQLMDECAELVRDAMRIAGRSVSVRESSYRQLYHDSLGLDPLTASEAELRAPLAVFDINAEG